MDLTVEVYRVSESLPVAERFGMQSQMRRSAVSIPSNIAEGAGRNSNGEWKHFLGIANGSAFELSTQLMICTQLGLLPSGQTNELIKKTDQIQNMIFRLITSIESDT